MRRKAIRTKPRNPRDATAAVSAKARKRGDAMLAARIGLVNVRLRGLTARVMALEGLVGLRSVEARGRR